eukprot:scaffold182777_cov22-Tisochrysis_lutea.AAC.2
MRRPAQKAVVLLGGLIGLNPKPKIHPSFPRRTGPLLIRRRGIHASIYPSLQQGAFPCLCRLVPCPPSPNYHHSNSRQELVTQRLASVPSHQ